MGSSLAAMLIAGCAAGAVRSSAVASPFGGRIERRFDAPHAAVWQAALSAVEPASVARADVTHGVIETGWREEVSSRSQGLLARAPFEWRARYRLQISEHDAATWVAVMPMLEERAPVGARAFHWERVAPTAEHATALLDRLEHALGLSQHAG